MRIVANGTATSAERRQLGVERDGERACDPHPAASLACLLLLLFDHHDLERLGANIDTEPQW